ncbi:MAG: PilZ domain-containing protein [Candidatus Omnitrophica bacterium]|nr:PilZ domain-containing protein [Candidatus Omnitrophota bacterium]
MDKTLINTLKNIMNLHGSMNYNINSFVALTNFCQKGIVIIENMAALDLRSVKDFIVRVENREHTTRLLGTGRQGEIFVELTDQSTGESGMGKNGVAFFFWEGKWHYFTCKIFCPTLRRMAIVRTSPIAVDSRNERRYEIGLLSGRAVEKGLLHGIIDFNIINISKTGIRIETRQPMKVGKTYSVEMKLIIKHFSEIIKADCVVSNESRMGTIFHYGCQIVAISPENQVLLEKYLGLLAKA